MLLPMNRQIPPLNHVSVLCPTVIGLKSSLASHGGCWQFPVVQVQCPLVL